MHCDGLFIYGVGIELNTITHTTEQELPIQKLAKFVTIYAKLVSNGADRETTPPHGSR